MDRTTQSRGAHSYRPEDERAESGLRAAYAPESRGRHMHWPEPAIVDVAQTHLLAEVESKVVGRVVIDAVYPPFGELVNMEVLPPFTGRGAGGALVDERVAEMSRMGFMAVFLQTFADKVRAHRLYARKGFLIAAKGEMLRLVRFIGPPVLDVLLYEHPLATYAASAAEKPRQWFLAWSDWPTGDRLQLMLSGGSCQFDSDGYGPALCALSLAAGRAAGRHECRRVNLGNAVLGN